MTTATTVADSDPLGNSYPLCLRELSGTLPANAQFLLRGNIRDLQHMPGPSGALRRVSLLDALWQVFDGNGYEALLIYDPVAHLRVHTPAGLAAERAASAHAVAAEVLRVDRFPQELTLSRLGALITALVNSTARRVAVVLDYASRLTLDPEHLSDEERAFFVTMEKLSHTAQPLFRVGPRSVGLYNPVVWLVDTERDVPAWFMAGNDGVRVVSVPLPDLGDRAALAAALTPSLPAAEAAGDDLARAVTTFAAQTQGMTLRSLIEIQRLAIDRAIDVADIEDAVRCYRVGILDNPWKRPLLRRRIGAAGSLLTARVRGQNRAVRKSADILIRSATGLTGAHVSAHVARPRGILFFAGPTGVGKTELAKSIAELVFGHEDAYIRFDMSEFSSEHSEARLIGAPPGYVGHGAGGELTNAVRDRPFSLVLFDEIEKAHPRILDKFLQVLDDGRLTDGAGTTVHFSEALIVFTSNLGIYVEDEHGRRTRNVEESTTGEELERRIREAITQHFTLRLNRPELLNRIGTDNIVVFEFIDEPTAIEIAELFLANIVTRVGRELQVELSVSESARATVVATSTADRSFGGRGIGAVIETMFVNPLARALFSSEPAPGSPVRVTAVRRTDLSWEVELAC